MSVTGSLSVANSLHSSVVDILGDKELVETVEKIRSDNGRIALENYILHKFLSLNDPTLIANMSQVLEAATKIVQINLDRSASSNVLTNSSSLKISQNNSGSFVTSNIAVSIVNQSISTGPGKVNLVFRMEMIQKEIDDINADLDLFISRSNVTTKEKISHIEMLDSSMKDISDWKNSFENQIVIEGVDLLTGRIPGDRVIRWLLETIRMCDRKVERLRLRQSMLRLRLEKVKNQLVQKEELGETVHPIDFEILQIEKNNLLETLEIKNSELIDMKKMTGQASLVLTIQKKFMYRQSMDRETTLESIAKRHKQVTELHTEAMLVAMELQQAQSNFHRIKKMNEDYTVPAVMDYVKKRAELLDLKKKIKVWKRKLNIQQIEFKTAQTRLKRLTGASKPLGFKIEMKKSIADTYKIIDKHLNYLENRLREEFAETC